ncbi:hypothetical protein D3C81_526960 [compost metagenome]
MLVLSQDERWLDEIARPRNWLATAQHLLPRVGPGKEAEDLVVMRLVGQRTELRRLIQRATDFQCTQALSQFLADRIDLAAVDVEAFRCRADLALVDISGL